MENNKSQNELDITEEIKNKWQTIITTIASILNVPAGLIMRIVDSDITVFLSSKTKNNPYTPGDKEHFNDSGLYCETVVKNNKMLLVPNALSDEEWKNNPDVKLNMISYLGLPISLPDKTSFGTLCVLDNKENKYSELYIDLMKSFRDTIERDIELIYNNHTLQKNNSKLNALIAEKENILREIHHRVKNNIASIEGLLSLQIDYATNMEVKSALEESRSHVQSMRVLYEKLLFSKDYQEVSSKNYIESLIDSIVLVFPESEKVTIEKRIADFQLSSNRLAPIGMAINEILTNAFKYAFEGRENGHILIILEIIENQVVLTVQDNGVGLREGIDLNNSSGFGYMMLKAFTKSYTIENKNGTRSILKF